MKILYNWKEAPEWAKYAARDSNGFAHWFEELPRPSSISAVGVEWLSIGTTRSLHCNPFWSEYNNPPDAIFSLEKRHTNAEMEEYEKHIQGYGSLNKELVIASLESSCVLIKAQTGILSDPLIHYLGKEIEVIFSPSKSYRVSLYLKEGVFCFKQANEEVQLNARLKSLADEKFKSIFSALLRLTRLETLRIINHWEFTTEDFLNTTNDMNPDFKVILPIYQKIMYYVIGGVIFKVSSFQDSLIRQHSIWEQLADTIINETGRVLKHKSFIDLASVTTGIQAHITNEPSSIMVVELTTDEFKSYTAESLAVLRKMATSATYLYKK